MRAATSDGHQVQYDLPAKAPQKNISYINSQPCNAYLELY